MQVLFQQYQSNISYPSWAKTSYFTPKANCYSLATLYLGLQAHQHSYQYSHSVRESIKVRQIHKLIIKVLLTYYQEKNDSGQLYSPTE